MTNKKLLPIGDRMKLYYEDRYRVFLTRRTPVIVRLDGKAFHTLTRRCQKPFDQEFISAMLSAAAYVTMQSQGFKLAYIQSDKVSFLLTDYDALQTEAYFDYNLQKLVSVMASQMSANFSLSYSQCAAFDGRAFNMPKEEIANYFLWRALDWQRNSIQMYAQSFFSHKQLHKKTQLDMHEMLHDIGKNWATDLTDREKNGTFILRDGTFNVTTKPIYAEIEALLDWEKE